MPLNLQVERLHVLKPLDVSLFFVLFILSKPALKEVDLILIVCLIE
jgi:hypothetical protein